MDSSSDLEEGLAAVMEDDSQEMGEEETQAGSPKMGKEEEVLAAAPAAAAQAETGSPEMGEEEEEETQAAMETALEPTGTAAFATVLDEHTVHTAGATALDEPMGQAATAATVADEPTGLTAPAAATALDDPSGLTAAPATAVEDPSAPTAAAATVRDEPMGSATAAATVPDDAMGPSPPAATAASVFVSPEGLLTAKGEEPRLEEAEEAAAELGLLDELRDVINEGEKAEEASIEEELLGDLKEMREAPAVPPPPPPPAAAPTDSERRESQFDGAAFIDESRYMQDAKGNYLHKWKVEYATRGGGGVAMCRDMECLERHAQGGVRSIEKGELRIGRRVLMDKDGDAGHVVIMWHHARCIFNTFLRSRKSTRVIESVEDLEGFHDIRHEDQELLRRIIAGNEDVRAVRSRTTGATKTPEKRPAPGGNDMEDRFSAKKARGGKREEEKRLLRKGDRVWTFCRVRPPAAPDRPGGVPVIREFAVKSPKPELGMIVEEADKDDSIVVQFESAEHEQERIEKFQSSDKRLAKIKAWFMYPRVFEGKKQRLPLSWVQSKPPPKLCGCQKQQWAHPCEHGITCTRGTSTKVWGVCQ